MQDVRYLTAPAKSVHAINKIVSDFTVDENSNVDENEDRLSSSICSPSSI
jgi:hypothetical protein